MNRWVIIVLSQLTRILITVLIILSFTIQTGITSINKYMENYSGESKFDVREQQWLPTLDSKLEPLRNIEYKCGAETFANGEAVKFKNGIFKKDDNSFSVIFRGGDYGDLNGDGKQDGIAYFASKYESGKVWITLAIVMNQNGELKNTDCLVLGDREIIQSIRVKPHEVTLEMLMHLSGEPSCCPKTPFTYTFKISDDGHITNSKEFLNISLASDELALGNTDYANNQISTDEIQ